MRRHIKKITIICIFIGVFLYLFSPYIFTFKISNGSNKDGSNKDGSNKVYSLRIDGAISPANADYFIRGLDTAIENKAELLLLSLNTPGGLDKSMRSMIQAILASPVPVVIYISPKGARGASAGTYLMYASHIAAMAPATNIGSATPISIGMDHPLQPPDERDSNKNGDKNKEENGEKNRDKSDPSQAAQQDEMAPKSIMQRKMLNDAQAYIRSLAQLRGRNEEWAIKAVTQAANLSATEALELEVIDFIAYDQFELLALLDQREVNLGNKKITLDLTEPEIISLLPDWRTELLIIITDPSIAYLLLLAGIYGLVFEFLNPGGLIAGVIGSICLVVALYAFNLLPINLAGFALLIIGIGLMVAEAFAPSFGVLGLGGIIAFIVGAFMLMDSTLPGYQIAPALIIASALASGFILIVIMSMLLKNRKNSLVSGVEQLIGHSAIAVEDFHESDAVQNGDIQTGPIQTSHVQTGRVQIEGEIWLADSDQNDCEQTIKKNQKVRVKAIDGLTLKVKAED